MAGIAFRLQSLLNQDSPFSVLRAYVYSTIISAGPFLLTIFLLATLKYFLSTRISHEEATLFFSLVVYAFLFSIMGCSPFFYCVTRYMADQIYLKRAESFVPCFLASTLLIYLFLGVINLVFLFQMPLTFWQKLWFHNLTLVCAGLWMAMIFSSATRNYLQIVLAFFMGALVSFATALLAQSHYGLTGLLAGFCFGQTLSLSWLCLLLWREFGQESWLDFSFFDTIREHQYLIWIGLFYYGGTWIDKIILWQSEFGVTVFGVLKTFSTYDTASFLAFTTVIPSMAFFLIQIETLFELDLNAYFAIIQQKGTYEQIQDARQKLVATLSLHFEKFALFQGVISGLIILFLVDISDFFGWPPEMTSILRIMILGSFLHIGMLMCMNIMFYFDMQRQIYWLMATFFLSNTLFTIITIKIGFISLGFGYTLACFISSILAIYLLNQRLKNLDYHTFMLQPLI